MHTHAPCIHTMHAHTMHTCTLHTYRHTHTMYAHIPCTHMHHAHIPCTHHAHMHLAHTHTHIHTMHAHTPCTHTHTVHAHTEVSGQVTLFPHSCSPSTLMIVLSPTSKLLILQDFISSRKPLGFLPASMETDRSAPECSPQSCFPL